MLYLANGNKYRFTSGIGIIKLEKYKPRYLGHNLPKAIKIVAKEQNLSYTDAKFWIKDNRDKVKFEERKNLIFKGFKFKLFWYNNDTNIPFKYYWFLSLIRSNSKKYGFSFFKKYFTENPDVFSKLEEKLLSHDK